MRPLFYFYNEARIMKKFNEASIEQFFQKAPYKIEDNENLREPQIEAYLATKGYFHKHCEGHVILQLPVGCGKTGLMAILPFGISTDRVLIVAPNLEIRRGIFGEFDISGPNPFLKKTGVLTNFSKGPFPAVLEGENANVSDCQKSHVVITNIQQLASSADRWLPQFPANFFDLILIDEGHHNVAPSWMKVFDKFPEAKVVSLTATPIRGDGQRIIGIPIYRYPFNRAMVKGYIKQITSVNVAPKKISFTYKGDKREHTLEEVLQLREEDWFNKGVALARECNISIVDASIQWLRYMRTTGTRHQTIAVACSVDHAREVRSLYQERGCNSSEIYSQMKKEKKEEVLRNLRNGKLDCIVQVQMLGEGFDHPPLSVAVIFRPFRSLSPYIQFVGRIMRVIHQNSPGHPDNEGIIVSHLGLNMDKYWEDFKDFDKDDQEVIDKWLTSEEVFPDIDGREKRTQRPRLTPDMIVLDEIVDKFITQDFIDMTDEAILDQLIATIYKTTGLNLESLGLSRNELKTRLIKAKKKTDLKPEKIVVSPQKQRQQARKRLDERARSLTNKILGAIDLSVNTPQLVKYFPHRGAINNFAVVIQLVNIKICEKLGVLLNSRDKLTLEQVEYVYGHLDNIGDEVQKILEEKLKK